MILLAGLLPRSHAVVMRETYRAYERERMRVCYAYPRENNVARRALNFALVTRSPN